MAVVDEIRIMRKPILIGLLLMVAFWGFSLISDIYHSDMWLVDDSKSQFWIHKSVINNSRVYGLADICYDGGTRDLIQIFDSQFWCDEKNMYDIPTQSKQPQIPNTVGQNRKLRQASIIYSNSNLSGSKFNYKSNTSIVILENISSTIDKVKVVQTGRTGYIKNNNYK